MVHRDLKLENFILMGDSEENYTPKMIVFGLGRHFPDANHSFATVNACGTPAVRNKTNIGKVPVQRPPSWRQYIRSLLTGKQPSRLSV